MEMNAFLQYEVSEAGNAPHFSKRRISPLMIERLHFKITRFPLISLYLGVWGMRRQKTVVSSFRSVMAIL